ncbi:MAG: peptide chain release factor N(5)-glutamine methyltransferase [Armatimonadetes bacterium]|nr:peptide chain release factor N(5)-glutamine methyltransferase [Armatimonadota bacterium]
MTVREALHQTEQKLKAARIRFYEVDARLLLAHCLGTTMGRLPTLFADPVNSETIRMLDALVTRRAAREPLSYVLGETEFMSLRFHCDARVLTPRPDTEILVEAVIETVRARFGEGDSAGLILADIGTGSGCIAVALAHALPAAEVIATDLSADALDVARANAALNGLEHRITFLQGPDLGPLVAAGICDRVQVVVSNPPYIPERDFATLEPEVVEHEPHLALYGGEDGLDGHRRILGELSCLPNVEVVAFEFGFEQEGLLEALTKSSLPGWDVSIRNDLAGFPRAIIATK